MAAESIQDRQELWDRLVCLADDASSGLLAQAGEAPMICRVAAGAIVEIDGDVAASAFHEAVVSSGLAKAQTVQRALAASRIARTDLVTVLAELGVLAEGDEEKLENIRYEAALRGLILGDGPWEWRPMAIDGEGPLLLPIVARTLAGAVEAKQLGLWGGAMTRMQFESPNSAAWQVLPKQVQAFLSQITPASDLRALLASGRLPPREALTWVAIGLRLAWLTSPDAVKPPAKTPAAGDDQALEIKEEPAVGAEEPEIIEDAVLELEPEAETAGDAEVLEFAEADVVEPAPPAAPVAPVAAAAPKFYEQPVPASIYERLGLPEGAAGQGVAQAYSKRTRRVQKMLEESPGDPLLEAWKLGLLKAYRIISHSVALALYEKLSGAGEAGDVADRVAEEVGKKALARGLQQLRRGNPFEGAKAIQEALTWLPESAEAWLALGFYQASLDDPDEFEQAFISFSRAVELAPDNPQSHYFRGVTAHFAGRSGDFDVERQWFEANPHAHLEAWQEFTATVA